MQKTENSQIPVVILCGGFGTRLGEETDAKPKPMVEIGGRPILWHIMKHYSHYGFSNFILCLGYKGHIIRDFFLNYENLTRDVRVRTGTNKSIEILGHERSEDWNIILADTGASAMTGARIKRIEKYIDSEVFLLTYGDGLSNINLDNLLKFHEKSGKIGTVTGVRPPARFGELIVDAKNEKVLQLSDKSNSSHAFINGGFFAFQRKFFQYLSEDDDCTLEKKPLEKLATDDQLKMFQHDDFWQCMDTPRDMNLLRSLWSENRAPWKNWQDQQ